MRRAALPPGVQGALRPCPSSRRPSANMEWRTPSGVRRTCWRRISAAAMAAVGAAIAAVHVWGHWASPVQAWESLRLLAPWTTDRATNDVRPDSKSPYWSTGTFSKELSRT